MPTRTREDTKKHTIRLRKGDAADIDLVYPNLGHNKVIRQIVSNFVDGLRANKAVPVIEIKEELP